MRESEGVPPQAGEQPPCPHDLAVEDAHHAAADEQEQQARSEDMVQKLTDLDALKSQFISMTSHEFRTPLSIIKGFANLLRRREEFGFDRATEIEYLEVIDAQVIAMTQVIDNTLSVSRIEAGQVHMHPQDFDLTATIRRVVATVGVPAASRAITIDAQSPPVLRAYADPQQIEHALVNLVSNAVKYSADGSAVAIQAVPENEMAIVSVTDHGVGIAAEDVSLLFQKFVRLENQRSVEAGGTGLGLYIAKSWIEANGGRLWVESTLDAGSTFFFSVPLAASAAPSSVT